MRNPRNYQVFQRSHQLVLEIYRHSRAFPKEEIFGLTSQMRRAAASIPANIAEGCGRGSDADFARFIHIASGSACELEYHCLLARDLGYINDETFSVLDSEVNEVKKMLVGLGNRLTAKSQLLTAKPN